MNTKTLDLSLKYPLYVCKINPETISFTLLMLLNIPLSCFLFLHKKKKIIT